jgi:hypothetical protein
LIGCVVTSQGVHARTIGDAHSSMAVASNALVSTHFDVPSAQERGFSALQVVANGIASPPVYVLVY